MISKEKKKKTALVIPELSMPWSPGLKEAWYLRSKSFPVTAEVQYDVSAS